MAPVVQHAGFNAGTVETILGRVAVHVVPVSIEVEPSSCGLPVLSRQLDRCG